jgi:hypothetical protein
LIDVEHNLDATLNDAFGVSSEGKQETIRKLYARSKDVFYLWVNRIRMHFGLNIKDAATATWKVIGYLREVRPDLFYNFNSSIESMLDAYYRAYPQHEFIQWVIKESQTENNGVFGAEDCMYFLERNVPDAATFIKRKMRLKKK